MRRLVALLLVLGGTASAQPALERPDAFERGFAVSLYQFDACGDPLAGRMFRRALADRFAQCPFTPAARARFAERTRAEQAKARRAMSAMIDSTGGVPVKLEGMAMTCHEQQASEEYRQLRGRLEQYADGKLAADAIITTPCDAQEIVP